MSPSLKHARNTRLTGNLQMTVFYPSYKFAEDWIYGVWVTAPQRKCFLGKWQVRVLEVQESIEWTLSKLEPHKGPWCSSTCSPSYVQIGFRGFKLWLFKEDAPREVLLRELSGTGSKVQAIHIKHTGNLLVFSRFTLCYFEMALLLWSLVNMLFE